jgi:hypothetical protein
MGIILLISTVLPLWAALLITGIAIFITGGIMAYVLLTKKIVLNTPSAPGMAKNEKS